VPYRDISTNILLCKGGGAFLPRLKSGVSCAKYYDDFQLLWATAQGRIIFTHNIRDFIDKTRFYPHHNGILLAHRSSYSLADLIHLIDRALKTTSDEEWVGQIRWLSDWKSG
jgi:hypothetical protein